MKRRLLSLRFIFLIIAGIAFGRLYQLQIICHKPFSIKAARQHQRNLDPCLRGTIYDRNGRELAVSLPVMSAYLNPSRVKDSSRLKTVAEVLDINPVRVQTIADSDKSFVWLKRKITPGQKKVLQNMKVSGVGFAEEKNRFYPKKMLAAHILGIVGVDGVGLEGLEYYYDQTLQGEGYNRCDLVLTIDETIQYLAQKELAAACQQTRAKAGTVIVMDPRNGEIMAMANYPAFNPNSFKNYPIGERRNRAITDVYEPGSTMKVFIAAAALQERLYTPQSQIWCEKGEIKLGELIVEDSGKYGMLSFSKVLELSSNVGAIKIGKSLGKKRLYRYLRNFGFGVSTDIGFPGESTGILRSPQDWSDVSSGVISIGQEIGVTPLQLVTAMSAVANGGYLVKPRLVKAVQDAESKKTVKQFEPQIVGKRVISASTAKTLGKILNRVVEYGTGKEADLPGIKVAGKTGTAQKFDSRINSYSKDKVVASFVGYWPVDSPELVILAIIDEPRELAWGGKAAAPLFRRVSGQIISYMAGSSFPKQESILTRRKSLQRSLKFNSKLVGLL